MAYWPADFRRCPRTPDRRAGLFSAGAKLARSKGGTMTAFVDPQSVHPELRSLFGDPRPVDRRAFIVTSLGAGFAAAVLPVSAQTITTSGEGLVAGEVKI